MVKIQLLCLDDILVINQKICASVKQESTCMDKGKIEGDQIKFTVEIPAYDQKVEYVAKRVQ